ncbi:MAG TPA: hypothetical protein VEQ35_10225 [Beijerinckia sp.]|jgi:hypothetical protein|nr:hypothetical protein [Beijerinckia sp.]
MLLAFACQLRLVLPTLYFIRETITGKLLSKTHSKAPRWLEPNGLTIGFIINGRLERPLAVLHETLQSGEE